MSPGRLYTDIAPPFCLEEGQRYQIKFTFDQYDPAKTDPKANILIDAVCQIAFSLFHQKIRNFVAKLSVQGFVP